MTVVAGRSSALSCRGRGRDLRDPELLLLMDCFTKGFLNVVLCGVSHSEIPRCLLPWQLFTTTPKGGETGASASPAVPCFTKMSVTVTARCLCNAHVFTSTIPNSSLPLLASLCHCNSCRHQTGALYFGCIAWPNKQEDLSSLKRYEFSPNTDLFACPTCSSQLFCRATQPGEGPEVITSALDNEPGLVEYGSNIFVGDTIDGGASMWFRHDATGGLLKRWSGHRGDGENLEVGWPDQGQDTVPRDDAGRPEYTPLQCHCKGVSLFVRSGAHLGQPAPGSSDAELAKKLKDSGFEMKSGRYPAFADACSSCRMHVGSDITFWATVPIVCLSVETNRHVDVPFRTVDEFRDALEAKDARFGTLKKYKSSLGVERYSCAICSASFFATNAQAADDRVIDVAVGVLHHKDGARAEGLLAWDYSRIDFSSDGDGGWRESLNRTALQEAKKWRGE